MGDPLDFILAEAGSISSSQEEVLRRSRFFRHPQASSSSSSGEGGDGGLGAAAARYRISVPPITMRSASDSHSSSSSPSNARDGSRDEVAQPHDGQHHRCPLEVEGRAEELSNVGYGGEGLGHSVDGGDLLLANSGEQQNRASMLKRKHSPVEEEAAAEEDGSFGEARRGKKPRIALSDESTQEPEGISSSEGYCGDRSGRVSLDSLVPSFSGRVVEKRLAFSGGGQEPSRDGNPQPSSSGDRLANDVFAKFKYVTPASRATGSPEDGVKDAVGLRRLPPSIQNPTDREADVRTLGAVPGKQPEPAGSGISASGRRRPRSEDGRTLEALSGKQPEVERLPGTGLGTSPVENSERLEGQGALERGPSAYAQCPPLPKEKAPEEVPKDIRLLSDVCDILLKFSKKPTERLENVDFLEVLAMKGIHIPPPRWWRPEGYTLQVLLAVTRTSGFFGQHSSSFASTCVGSA